MIIYRRYYGVAFECDSCGDQFDTEHHDFREALDRVKHNDWAIRNIDGQWCHICPDCQGAEIN